MGESLRDQVSPIMKFLKRISSTLNHTLNHNQERNLLYKFWVCSLAFYAGIVFPFEVSRLKMWPAGDMLHVTHRTNLC